MKTVPVKVHNRFDFELSDVATGAVKQRATCYNIVLNQYFTRLVQNNTTIDAIGLGTGTGTPNITRTSLFNYLIWKSATVVDSHVAYPTSWVRKKITLSPSECVGAVITEVGLGGSRNSSFYLCTHSMLKDSEGNQIAITKSDTDVLTVYATFYVTVNIATDGSFVLPSDPNNSYIIYKVLGVGSGSYYSSVYFGASRDLADSYAVQYSAIGSASISMSYDVTNLRLNFTATRLNYDCSFNDHMFSDIGIPTIATWKLPNADIFPNITLENVAVGNGDGSRTEFNVPIPMFVKNSEVIRVNGVVMERGVDYTVDNEANNAGYEELYPCAYRKNVSTLAGHGYWNSDYTRPVMLAGQTQQQSGLYFPVGGSNLSSPTKYTGFDFGSVQRFNTIRIPAASLRTSYSWSSTVSDTLILQYSVDGETWTTACEQSVNGGSDEIVIRLSPEVSARYWRGWARNSYNIYAIKWPNLSIYYEKPGLVFTNPPADGAAIEMDCQIDRPIKNENWVLDFSCAIEFSRG